MTVVDPQPASARSAKTPERAPPAGTERRSPMASPDRILEMLAALGADVVLRGPEDLSGRHPGSHPENFGAGAMALPAGTADAVAVVEACARHGIAVVPQGGRTGLVGGTVSAPGQLILSTERMRRIESIDRDDGVAVVQAGVTLEALQAAAAAQGLDPGIDIGSRGTATIGGMVSTNAGGIQAFRNGVMRHRVLGLEAVLPDGQVLGDLTRVVKSTAGFDVKQLLVGGEGAFGLVTRVAVKLEPAAPAGATALVAVPSAAAGLAVARHFAALPRCALRAAEMMWSGFARMNAEAQGFALSPRMRSAPALLVVETGASHESAPGERLEAGLADLWETCGLLDAIVAGSLDQARRIWHLREDTGTFARLYPGYLSFDVSVPPSRADDYVQAIAAGLASLEAGLEPLVFGHVADGNLHVIPNRAGPYPDALRREVEEVLYGSLERMGGSFSAEHGIGLKKKDAFDVFGDAGKLAMARRLKAALDPDRLFNPGKVV